MHSSTTLFVRNKVVTLGKIKTNINYSLYQQYQYRVGFQAGGVNFKGSS
jgi:hypothetical protein